MPRRITIEPHLTIEELEQSYRKATDAIEISWAEEPIATVNWRFQWLWLYGFVHPSSGDTYWWLLPKVNSSLFNRVLEDFAQHYQLGLKKRVILAMAQAGWHPLKETAKIPEGIHLIFMPSHSSELQPAERLWPSFLKK